MKKYDELSEKEKRNFEEFLILTFEFSEDELAAIDKQKPMTMDLFSSCLAKCTEWGLYKLFERLLDEYPDLTDKYVKTIDDDIKDVILPERTPEEEEESWKRLCERIKKEYGDDLLCEQLPENLVAIFYNRNLWIRIWHPVKKDGMFFYALY